MKAKTTEVVHRSFGILSIDQRVINRLEKRREMRARRMNRSHFFVLMVFDRILLEDLVGPRFQIIRQGLQRNLQSVFVPVGERFQHPIDRIRLLGKDRQNVQNRLFLHSSYSRDVFQVMKIRFERGRIVRTNSFDDELNFQLNTQSIPWTRCRFDRFTLISFTTNCW